jgi:hypothetical protein
MGIDSFEISFSFSGGGEGLSVNRSWMKGISYLPRATPVGHFVRSLDTLPLDDGQYYVPIEGNWYVVYKQLE